MKCWAWLLTLWVLHSPVCFQFSFIHQHTIFQFFRSSAYNLKTSFYYTVQMDKKIWNLLCLCDFQIDTTYWTKFSSEILVWSVCLVRLYSTKSFFTSKNMDNFIFETQIISVGITPDNPLWPILGKKQGVYLDF